MDWAAGGQTYSGRWVGRGDRRCTRDRDSDGGCVRIDSPVIGGLGAAVCLGRGCAVIVDGIESCIFSR